MCLSASFREDSTEWLACVYWLFLLEKTYGADRVTIDRQKSVVTDRVAVGCCLCRFAGSEGMGMVVGRMGFVC